MAKTIVVCGYGPAISHSVAERFGRAGYSVALVGRTVPRLEAAVAALRSAGTKAHAFPCDVSDEAAVRALFPKVRSELGPISVLHWNAFAPVAGNLTTAPMSEVQKLFDVTVYGLVASVQECLTDLKMEKGAVLVTGGGLALYNPSMDALAANWDAMGLAVAKAAQHKLVGVLHQKLSAEGIYVGEVTVLGLVKGTAHAPSGSGLDPADIADAFFRIHEERKDVWVNFPATAQ